MSRSGFVAHRDKTPLHTGRETRTPTTTQSGVFDFLKAPLGRHIGQGFAQARVPSVSLVILQEGWRTTGLNILS